ncbi:MAG: class I SAM-dependent methyltransferase [Candidatus Latescibacterota bacterium]
MAERVCPIWAGYFLLSPIRKLIQNPGNILSPYVGEGMTVLDYGCAMGYFSIPLAHMVGPRGKVICVDIQEKMLEVLKNRARKAGVSDRIETHLCNERMQCLENLAGKIDFVLAFAVVHEVADPYSLFKELWAAIKPSGKILVAEPKKMVSDNNFAKTIEAAQNSGLYIRDYPHILTSSAILFEKII